VHELGPIRMPPLMNQQGSLPPIEKSLLAHFISMIQPTVIVELGVLRAVTTEFMCRVLVENGFDGKVVGFDLDPVVEDLRAHNEAVKQYEASGQLELVPGRLPDSLKWWLRQTGHKIDLALVDGTHDYRSVLGELELLWPWLSDHGVILCDDYSEKYDGVRYAVHRFVRRHRDAMAMPLGSPRTLGTPYGSALAGVCRSPIRITLRGYAPHLIHKVKGDILARSALARLWRILRPLNRREG